MCPAEKILKALRPTTMIDIDTGTMEEARNLNFCRINGGGT